MEPPTTTERELLEAGFERLRTNCDPRGWDLLDTLKKVALTELAQNEARGELINLVELEEVARALKIASDRLWVSNDRCLLVRLWSSGKVEVATRPATDHTWGPPTLLDEETV